LSIFAVHFVEIFGTFCQYIGDNNIEELKKLVSTFAYNNID